MSKKLFRQYVLPWLAWIFFRVWTWTWRIEYLEPPLLQKLRKENVPLIFAHWHGHELSILPLVTGYKISTMTSTSQDGALIDFIIKRMGGATSRGSSTRGGIGALKGLIRLLKSGFNASMAVDGPKGPLHQVKSGVFELSRLAQARIVVVAAKASRSIVFHKAWNKAELPKPFARVIVAFGEPWEVIGKQEDFRSGSHALRLSDELSKACKVAEEHLP